MIIFLFNQFHALFIEPINQVIIDMAKRTGKNEESTMNFLKLLPRSILNVSQGDMQIMLRNLYALLGFENVEIAMIQLEVNCNHSNVLL